MSNREKMKKIGLDTLNIIEQGTYKNNAGQLVNIKNEIEKSVKNTVLYSPKDTNVLLSKIKKETEFETKFEVLNETTLEGSKKSLEEGLRKVIALNFASAKNPGGGFLKGSMAQEESLARSSALYATLLPQSGMYEANKKTRSCLYTDYMIYSPDVPVFREDNGDVIDKPYHLSFITSPAVNAGVVKAKERHITQTHIDSVMKKRIEKILAVALYNNYEVIVLGAYGCGVFRNSPKAVAGYFYDILKNNSRFKNKFKKVVFAVMDHSEHKLTYRAFIEKFSK